MDRVAADTPTRRRREAEGRVLVLILGKRARYHGPATAEQRPPAAAEDAGPGSPHRPLTSCLKDHQGLDVRRKRVKRGQIKKNALFGRRHLLPGPFN